MASNLENLCGKMVSSAALEHVEDIRTKSKPVETRPLITRAGRNPLFWHSYNSLFDSTRERVTGFHVRSICSRSRKVPVATVMYPKRLGKINPSSLLIILPHQQKLMLILKFKYGRSAVTEGVFAGVTRLVVSLAVLD